MSPKKPPLDPAAFRSVCAYAVAEVVLPDDVIRLAGGCRPREPFLISQSQLVRSFRLGKRYLSILSALYQGSSKAFDAAVPKLRGTIRTYFGRTREEVESTGRSNDAAPIPDTPWFASINNSDFRRFQNVAAVMTHMGFSYDYSQMVGGLCLRHEARLPRSYVTALGKLPNA